MLPQLWCRHPKGTRYRPAKVLSAVSEVMTGGRTRTFDQPHGAPEPPGERHRRDSFRSSGRMPCSSSLLEPGCLSWL
jgi:hypothetical protein